MDYDYIKINGSKIYRPLEFALKREDVYAAEIKSCTGKIIADKIGWKYSDRELKWDALTQDMVDILVDMSKTSGVSTITFDDADGIEHTENIITSSGVWTRHRYTHNGQAVWKDVEVGVRFIDVHN